MNLGEILYATGVAIVVIVFAGLAAFGYLPGGSGL